MVTQIAAVQPQPVSPNPPASASDQPQSSGEFSQLLHTTLKEQQGSANASKSDGTSGGKAEGPGKKSDSQESSTQAPAQTAVSLAGIAPNGSLSAAAAALAAPTSTRSALAVTVPESAGAGEGTSVSAVSANAVVPTGNPATPSVNSPVLPDAVKGTAKAEGNSSPVFSAPVSSASLPQTAAEQTGPDPVSASAAAMSPAVSELPNPQPTVSKSAGSAASERKTGKTVSNPAVEADQAEAPADELPENPVSAPKAISPAQNGQTESSEKTADPQLSSAKTEQKANDSSVLLSQPRSNPYGTGNVVIKVSDAPVPRSAQPVFHQVANAISENMKNGKQEFQVDLYPQSLGKVTVKLVSENGLLTVELAASNPKTQSLLLSNSGDIRSILQSSANQQVVVQSQQAPSWYGQQQGGQSGARQQQQQQQSGQNRQDSQSEDSGAIFSAGDFLNLLQTIRSAV